MRGKYIVSLGVAVGLLIGPPAVSHAQQAPIELTPSGHWSLDYGDHACTLTRQFTSAEGDVLLQIEQLAPGHLVNVIVASEHFGAGRGNVSLLVEPGTQAREQDDTLRGRSGSLRVARFADSLLPDTEPAVALVDPASTARFRQLEDSITALSLTNAFDRPIKLNLRELGTAMEPMRNCVDDLLRSWGWDPAIAATVAVAPVRVAQIHLARRVLEAYPRDMARQGQSARVTVVLLVGPDGRVANCRAHNPEPFPVFETVTCEKLREYARYEPARDAGGNAVSGFDWMDVIFSLGS